jgi:membrane fusion protein (multidrug efflux system)
LIPSPAVAEKPADGKQLDAPPSPDAPALPAPAAATHAPARFFPILLGAVGAVIIVGLLLLGLLPKRQREEALAAANRDEVNRSPTVHVALPMKVASTSTLTLPGTLAPNRDTMLYARSSGFVRAWRVDLGDAVKAGDLLADIDQPDVDQELRQSRSTLEQARANVTQASANVALAKINMERQKNLGPQLTPQRDIDIATSNYETTSAGMLAATAMVHADEAIVARLEELVSFDHVTAPFDGVIAKRFIEVGNLVSAGSGSAIQPLYHLMQTDPVLILIDVPQVSASSILLGRTAKISTRNKDVAPITATVAHLARIVDPVTRTMHVELLAANKDGSLMPGMYIEVAIDVPLKKELLSVSAASLLLSGEGTRIAVVRPDGHVAIKSVIIDTDNGATLLISSGLDPADQVVLNPDGLIEEGLHVDIAKDSVPSGSMAEPEDRQSKRP